MWYSFGKKISGLYFEHRISGYRKQLFCYLFCMRVKRGLALRRSKGKSCKNKVKLSLCLTKHQADVLGSGGIAPRILDLGTRQRWVVSFTSWSLYPQGKSPSYPLDRRLGGPQSRSGRGCVSKNCTRENIWSEEWRRYWVLYGILHDK
jgi:hypothetical protein